MASLISSKDILNEPRNIAAKKTMTHEFKFNQDKRSQAAETEQLLAIKFIFLCSILVKLVDAE